MSAEGDTSNASIAASSLKSNREERCAEGEQPQGCIAAIMKIPIWPLGQAVKTSPFHGGNMGPNPVGVTKNRTAATAVLLIWKLSSVG